MMTSYEEQAEQILTHKKVCAWCKQPRPLNMFTIRKYKGTTHSYCKFCSRIKTKKYQEDNPEKYRESIKKSYQNNQEARLAKHKIYYQIHAEEIKQKSRQWRINNPDKAKNADLKKKYGVTLEQKQEIIHSQNGRCAACGTDIPGGKYNEWQLDHNHETKQVRGVLCSDCNLTLGNAKESIPRLEGLITYLRLYEIN